MDPAWSLCLGSIGTSRTATPAEPVRGGGLRERLPDPHGRVGLAGARRSTSGSSIGPPKFPPTCNMALREASCIITSKLIPLYLDKGMELWLYKLSPPETRGTSG